MNFWAGNKQKAGPLTAMKRRLISVGTVILLCSSVRMWFMALNPCSHFAIDRGNVETAENTLQRLSPWTLWHLYSRNSFRSKRDVWYLSKQEFFWMLTVYHPQTPCAHLCPMASWRGLGKHRQQLLCNVFMCMGMFVNSETADSSIQVRKLSQPASYFTWFLINDKFIAWN